MIDRELIQALRHCASDSEWGCFGCPGELVCDKCSGKAISDAADRLEELLAENEQLKAQQKGGGVNEMH